MSISNDMIALLKDDIDNVYKDGQNSVMDESRVIKKTASGVEFLHLNDVSEIPHKIDCKVESANLFGLELLTGEMVNVSGYILSNEPYTVENKVITNNRAIYYGTYFLCTTPFKLEAGSYKLSFKAKKNRDDGSLSIITQLRFSDGTRTGLEEHAAKIEVYNEDVYVKVSQPYKFDEEKIVTGICLQCVGKKDDTVNDVDDAQMQFWDIMLNKGSEALPYAPYGPSANTNVTVCGKNLWNHGDVEVVPNNNNNNYSTKLFRLSNPLPIGTYTFSGYVSSTDTDSTKRYVRCLDETYQTATGTVGYFIDDVKNVKVFTTTAPTYYIELFSSELRAGSLNDTSQWWELQLEKSPSSTNYEPYSAKIFTSNSDGSIDGIMSTDTNPVMNIFTDSNINIIAEYNKSYGMQTEYDRFWDVYQEGGNRTNYYMAFAGTGWQTADMFKPKYDLKPTDARYMFSNWKVYDLDIAKTLEDCGVVLDTSQCTQFGYLVQYGSTRHLPIIDTRAADNLNNLSVNSSLWTIDKIILRGESENGKAQTIKTMFNANHPGLKDIVFEGVIRNDFTLQYCPKLSKATILNVLDCLSENTTSLTLTFSKTAVNNAFETSSGAADGSTSSEWEELVASKSNWTISII